MDEEINQDEAGTKTQVRPRPFILTIICLVSFVYFSLISLLFLIGLFNAGWITSVTNQYMVKGNYTKAQVLLVFGAGFLLHAFAFTGIMLIWNLRKAGYYFLGLSCLIIAAYQLLNPMVAITSTAIYVFIILIFGVFYNRMH